MTLLIYSHEAEGVVLVMDTLVCDSSGPVSFASKAVAFPHANMVVAGTGLADIVSGWVNHLSTSSRFRDIVGASAGAVSFLRELEVELIGDQTDPELTTTIYHFGVERDSGRVVRYIYRSKNGFREERYEDEAFGFKPYLGDPLHYEQPDSIEEYVSLAERIRAEQADLAGDGLPIGGELTMTVLTGSSIRSSRIHTFDSYETDWASAMRRR